MFGIHAARLGLVLRQARSSQSWSTTVLNLPRASVRMMTEDYPRRERQQSDPRGTRDFRPRDSRPRDSRPREFRQREFRPRETPRSKAIRIDNLPTQATQSQLVELFSQFGPVREVTIKPAPDGADFTLAAVHFEDADHADHAINAHRTDRLMLDETVLHIQYGALTVLKEPSTTLFVGNLHFRTTENDVRDLLSSYGDIRRVSLSARGFAHVEYASVDHAKAAIEAHEAAPFHCQQGRLLRINYETPRPPSRTLCLAGFKGSAEELEETFQKHGCSNEIVNVTTFEPSPVDGRLQGGPLYFVHYPDVETATRMREILRASVDPADFQVDFGASLRRNDQRRQRGEDRSY